MCPCMEGGRRIIEKSKMSVNADGKSNIWPRTALLPLSAIPNQCGRGHVPSVINSLILTVRASSPSQQNTWHATTVLNSTLFSFCPPAVPAIFCQWWFIPSPALNFVHLTKWGARRFYTILKKLNRIVNWILYLGSWGPRSRIRGVSSR